MLVFRDMINYIGIASFNDYPLNPKAFKQFMLLEKVVIPEVKPDLEEIIKVMTVAKIKNVRQIKTPYINKFLINGVVKQRFVYTASNQEQSVHSFHVVNEFCEFIDLYCDPKTIKPKVVIEDIDILDHDLRSIMECKILCLIIESVEVDEVEEE